MLITKKGNSIFIRDAVICQSLISRMRGVMFKLRLSQAYVLEFSSEQIIPLHMLFVFFPIDVLFLDKKRRVVEVKERFLPFTFYSPAEKAQYVVEIPAGSVKQSRIRLGDAVVWESFYKK